MLAIAIVFVHGRRILSSISLCPSRPALANSSTSSAVSSSADSPFWLCRCLATALSFCRCCYCLCCSLPQLRVLLVAGCCSVLKPPVAAAAALLLMLFAPAACRYCFALLANSYCCHLLLAILAMGAKALYMAVCVAGWVVSSNGCPLSN